MGDTKLNKDELSHLTRCTFCIAWMRACVGEKCSVRAKARFFYES
jgi:hypothetical protein